MEFIAQKTPALPHDLMRLKKIFFSHNFPISLEQELLVNAIEEWIGEHGIICQTVKNQGVTEIPPIQRIRHRIADSDAVIALALPKDLPPSERHIDDVDHGNRTTPWVHMEASMAIQAGKPVVLIKDIRLPRDGVFDISATGLPVLEVDCKDIKEQIKKIRNHLENVSIWN